MYRILLLILIFIIAVWLLHPVKLEHYTFPNHGIYDGNMGPAVPKDRWLRDPHLKNAVISPWNRLAILRRDLPNDLNNCWATECPSELKKYDFSCWRCEN